MPLVPRLHKPELGLLPPFTYKLRSSGCVIEFIRSEIGTKGVANVDEDHGIIDPELDH